jgi:hypothetical protein
MIGSLSLFTVSKHHPTGGWLALSLVSRLWGLNNKLRETSAVIRADKKKNRSCCRKNVSLLVAEDPNLLGMLAFRISHSLKTPVGC